MKFKYAATGQTHIDIPLGWATGWDLDDDLLGPSLGEDISEQKMKELESEHGRLEDALESMLDAEEPGQSARGPQSQNL